MAEPQAQSLHLQSPHEMVSTWFSHNSKMPFQLAHCPCTEPSMPVRGLPSIQAFDLQLITLLSCWSVVYTHTHTFNFILSVWVSCQHVLSVHHGGQKAECSPLGLELHMVVSHPVGAENLT